MAEQPEIHNIDEPPQEEVQKELDKEPGDSLEPTVAGAAAANERLKATIDQSAGMGGDDDALGLETKIIEKVVGHEG
ncbi:MAG: hypothetical protein JWM17_1424 [Actinobacteria bacterium]|jgi:hypothetical protein|nr:hypothetical protein [Actinomycetota bacterium]MEA2503993.1 hypothetical protein [Actinomycetota bacterium]MEA2532595.1 hypothetical protein [Actinomycetota bacterium]MEA2565096.1 hypothetical protein [Actinomycetota bacterium]MEA2590319.1 hypothetical protein [Actinomycetota bacterium]